VGGLPCQGVWSAGSADWATNLPVKVELAASAPGLSSVPQLLPVVRRTARRPSAEPSDSLLLRSLFNLEANQAADFGSEVHALLASVEWADLQQRTALAAHWGAARPPGPPGRGRVQARPRFEPAHPEVALHPQSEAAAVLTAPALAELWERPAGNVDLWRERAFEAILGETWVTGMFDRVVIHRDLSGRPIRAVIYDFKTDRLATEEQIGSAVARHTPQLVRYRQAVPALTGLPAAAVQAELIFTRLCESRSVGPASDPANF